MILSILTWTEVRELGRIPSKATDKVPDDDSKESKHVALKQ